MARTPNQHIDYATWGSDIDDQAHEQMRNACSLPVSVSAALMPDAHVGYGLPIGGVLATEDSVIPYAVGVDIACRVMLSVFDLPASDLQREQDRFTGYIERNTLFGVGKGWRRDRPKHPVMDEDWSVSPVTSRQKDKAWEQLGTSGSGNHFVEFGEIAFLDSSALPASLEARNPRTTDQGEPTRFIAMVSHSGSRGTGAQVASHYSKAARELHPDLPGPLAHLAWLPLSGPRSHIGREYWAAMELMGRYASANHHVIHEKIRRSVGAPLLLEIENHHNFAWRETHGGREVIVHRKGATPAGRGVMGYIPGTMAAPGFLVQGLGNEQSLASASHGAGRRMSRTAARKTERWENLRSHLKERGVTLLSAGLDESPIAYKDIERVMAQQADLVRPIARFFPRLVKMAPDGERAED